MSVLEEFNGTMTEYEYQKQQERKRKRKAKVVKVLEELCDEIDNESADGFSEDCHGYIIGSMLTKEHIIEIINRKMAEVSGKDCRDCKKWEECECGKKGHDNGTSIGYSAGECSEYEVKGDKE